MKSIKVRGQEDMDIRRALFNSTIASDDTRSVKSAMPLSSSKKDANYLPESDEESGIQ